MDLIKSNLLNGIKSTIIYLIQFHKEKKGNLPKDISNKFVKNSLGFRVHKHDLSPLVCGEILSELDGTHIITEDGDLFIINYNKSDMWFTIKQR
jgi:hypothetical protein